jgi:hypothetical protein
MGLRTTHDCWNGSYSSFDQWRNKLAAVAGIDLYQMKGFGGPIEWDSDDALSVLLSHSDCEGSIAVSDLLPLADRLDELMPRLEEYDAQHPTGHQDYSVAWPARRFANGLRHAAWLGEPVEFH